ncbi:glycoside hydrolase family 55 protein [Roseibaca sp. V10]|uniref:Glycoside hydrolase family 55 protein n=1 Tax=Roseinatronobacter domitianus TaxID=2940293 RepID=A0ABT0M4J8_9RHOB|nr:glycoside hydrolase family 55 protein [Roseibaca domitiana]MCL1629777.1 glycoside hydrolase family 55 protein [Roseibaca domitiana]
MNMAVTQGLDLMPSPFAAGLDVWSQTTGRPGTPTYDSAAFAAFVPSDPDFDGCLEVQKVSATTRLRWMVELPITPGAYLRVRARVKGMAGVFPDVAVAAWVGNQGGTELTALPATGPATALTSYGEIVEISAIIGTGARAGVDMVWNTDARRAHFGLNLTGPTGGIIRIDDIIIEDVTNAYSADLLGVVDVLDYGAKGDGTTDDHAAFLAAISAAGTRRLLVPEGTFRIDSDLTIPGPVTFRGTLVMPDSALLILHHDFTLPAYEAALGNDVAGFRKGLQALFYTNQHIAFDMMGGRVNLTAPIDLRSLVGFDNANVHLVLQNGQLRAADVGNWDTVTTTRVATYNPANPFLLSGISNVAGIPVGARLSGVGVGREIYVRARNTAAGTLTLSQPLHGGAGTQNFTFERYQYLLDCSGFSNLSNFECRDIEFLCRGRASAVMLPEGGSITRFTDCDFDRPKDRGITSIGRGCQGLTVDRCQFASSQMPLRAQDRTVIAFNTNNNDAKIRNNRAVLWAHFGVMGGTGHIITGNHFFAGDDEAQGIRQAGLVLTDVNLKTTITGNYIDNCFIELSNEYAPEPNFSGGFSFGGLTVTGNIFIASGVAPWFNWIVLRPLGSGQFVQGLHVSGNVFRTVGNRIDRVDAVDTTFGSLDYTRFRNVIFDNNAYNGVDYPTESPCVVLHDQNTDATTWVVDTGDKLPFGGWARTVSSVVMEGRAQDASNATRYEMPYVEITQGPNSDRVNLRWPAATRGRAVVTVRVDRPL